MAIVHSSKFGLLFWSVIIVVISGWPGSMVHELSSFLFPASSSSPSSSHILVAAVSPPLSLSSSSMSMVRMSTDGKSDDEGMIMIADGENSGSRSSMSDVKAVAGQSLQLLCPIFTGTGQNVAASEDVAQEPIYWMKGKRLQTQTLPFSPFPHFSDIYSYLQMAGRKLLTARKVRKEEAGSLFPSNHFFLLLLA